MTGIVATVTSYADNGTVLFIESKGDAPANTDWEIQYQDQRGEWKSSSCVAKNIPGRDLLLRMFASIHPEVRAVAVVSEVAHANA